MSKRIRKTQQQKDGESLFRKIWKLFTDKKYVMRSATITDELNGKGGKRLTVFFTDNDGKTK